MSHPFDELVLEGSAALLFTPCPGTKTEALKDSLLTLKQAAGNLSEQDLQGINQALTN